MKTAFKIAILISLTFGLCSIAKAQSAVAGKETIVLAGGCFWGVEAVFEHTKGVSDVVSGYAGGSVESADYSTVSSGVTRHAEAVQVTYDPAQVSLAQILDVYFTVAHNPTQLNYQGPDHGTQYRSTVFYTTPEQKQTVENKISALNNAHIFPDTIVTTLEPLNTFYMAEDYHQDYAALNPRQPYIVIHDAPKVQRLKTHYPDLYRIKQ